MPPWRGNLGDLLSGDVGLVCQSGALLGSIWDMAMGHGLGYSALLSTGNEADLEASDFVEYFALDEKTRVITAFIEGLRNPQRFLEAVELAHKQQKPVIVYKIGRTEEASRGAASHTGALTGSDSTFEAMCQAHGIIRVDNSECLSHDGDGHEVSATGQGNPTGHLLLFRRSLPV